MAKTQVIVVVESTAAMGLYWDTLQRDYLDKIIMSFGENKSNGHNPYISNVEFALVTYNTHRCDSFIIVQRTGWTRDPNVFLQWLSSVECITTVGLNDAAIAEGLGEALMMMFPNSQSGGPNQHCILVAASNPYPLQTPVNVLQSIDSDQRNRLYDAEAVAKVFPQFSISLSVICPKRRPKVKAIYNAGKPNNKAAAPKVDAKTTPFIIFISEGFKEALGALNCYGSLANHSIITEPASARSKIKSVWKGSLLRKEQEKSVFITKLECSRYVTASDTLGANWPPVMQIVELISLELLDHMVKKKQCLVMEDFLFFRATKQHRFLDQLREKKLCAVIQLPSHKLLLIVDDISGCLNGMLFPADMHIFDIPLPSYSKVEVPSTSMSTGPGSAKSKFTRVWEGSLLGSVKGKPVFITKLEGYRNFADSETLAANWPPAMQIVRLISLDIMTNIYMQYVGEVVIIVFRAPNPHGFLCQLNKKKMGAAIELPSQTLLLSVSDRLDRLIGRLFPEKIVFKPLSAAATSSTSTTAALTNASATTASKITATITSTTSSTATDG